MEYLEKKTYFPIRPSRADDEKLKSYFIYNNSEIYKDTPYISVVKKNERSEESDNSLNADQVDIVIIVAVSSEHDGVYHAFNLQKNTQRNTGLISEYKFGFVRLEQDGLQIALLIQPGMGMTHSSSLATRAILAFKPKLIAMVGICAGREGKTSLGDIIIASDVFDYTAGKRYIDKFGPRPQLQTVDTTISEYVSTTIVNNSEIVGKILDSYSGQKPDHPINIQFKPMASGTAVIDDPKTIEEIATIREDLAAIDMEAYALATAANILGTKWIVVKSVQDYANGEKSKSEKSIRPFAAYSSAKLFQLMLKDLAYYI